MGPVRVTGVEQQAMTRMVSAYRQWLGDPASGNSIGNCIKTI